MHKEKINYIENLQEMQDWVINKIKTYSGDPIYI